MTDILPALEAFIARDGAWQAWMALVVRPDLPLLQVCRAAVRNQDDSTLSRCAELLEMPCAADRLYNAFATHADFSRKQQQTDQDSEISGDAINADRLHCLILAAIHVARMAIVVKRTFQTLTHKTLAALLQPGRSESMPADAASALTSLHKAGYGPLTLLHWLGSLLEVERAATTRVPIASVLDGNRGVITHLNLSVWNFPSTFAPALVPDLEAALTPTRADLLEALASVVPARLTRSISWHVARPTDLQSTHLGGSSLQGAAAAALWLLNNGEQFHTGILILAAVNREQHLRRVGHERPKLLAAVESYGHGRTSRYSADEENSIQKVIFAEESHTDLTPAIERGLPCVRLATVDDAVAAVREATRSVDENRYHIDRSVRKIVAVSAPDVSGYVIDTSDGSVPFGPDSRTDYISEVQFHATNRFRDPYTLHYRARATGSLVEVDCHPDADNLFVDDTAGYESYLDLKKYFVFKFRPSADAVYRMHAKIYDGFGKSKRNMHCHFPDNAMHRVIEFELDLRVYQAIHPRLVVSNLPEHAPRVSIWRSQNPDLIDPASSNDSSATQVRRRYSRAESACDRFCDLARKSPQLVPCSTEPGLWHWQIEGVRFGAVLWADWENTIIEKEADSL
jgi:hypothetical protein